MKKIMLLCLLLTGCGGGSADDKPITGLFEIPDTGGLCGPHISWTYDSVFKYRVIRDVNTGNLVKGYHTIKVDSCP